MSAWLQALLLGVLQGLTEFLPVSSSGHLVLAQAWLGEEFVFVEQPVLFDIVLHLGTLVPVLWFYRREVCSIAGSASAEPRWEKRAGVISWLADNPDRRLALMIIVGSVPTAIIGLVLKDVFEQLFQSVTAVCAALFLTGCLLVTTRFRSAAQRGVGEVGVRAALLIGLAQALAITPGISRSGATIALALLLGLERDLAARFSFLLSVPAILGAMVLVAKDGVAIAGASWPALGIGFASGMVVGYLALWTLVALVRRGRLHGFALYLWPLAVGGWLLLG